MATPSNLTQSINTAFMLSACVGSVILGCGGPQDNQTPRTAADSHVRMHTALQKLKEVSAEEHPFVGHRKLREMRSLLELPTYVTRLAPNQKWRFFLDLGVYELQAGHERDSIAHLTESLKQADATSKPEHTRQISNYHLAVANLRLGETENCCQRTTSESCIVPIKGSGLHTKDEGSRTAIRHLKAVLNSPVEVTADNERLEVHESARWLLNIACMTIDEYPKSVPERFLVPPEFFESTVVFPQFKNMLPELGLDTFNLCGGVVVDDFDGDLDLDIITTTWDTGGQMKVFRNTGHGGFSDVTEESGLTGFYGGLNVNQADFDNDGDLDLFIMRGAWLREFGRHPNSLLRNDGGLRFTDVTFELGLAEPRWPTKTAAWADFDNDGDLDLFVGNETSTLSLYMGAPTETELIAPCQLFRNDGPSGFIDVAGEAGVAAQVFSMGAVWGDVNDDRYPDLFLSCIGDNRLYINNRDGTFTERANEAGVRDPPSSFATWFFDYDNDGDLDLFVGCNSGPVGVLHTDVRFHMMKLYENNGEGNFTDVAAAKGLTYPAEPMGANFGDLDNDGFLDFYLATGNVAYTEIRPNVMFRNYGGQRFQNVTMAGGFGHLQKGHGVSFSDIDNDGDLDVYVQLGGAYPGDRNVDALFQNPGTDNSAVTLLLQGKQSNRCAIGAEITLWVREGNSLRSIHRMITSGSSFGANSLRQTIGTGSQPVIDRLEIYWPTTDTRQAFHKVETGKAYVVEEGGETLRELTLPKWGRNVISDEADVQ